MKPVWDAVHFVRLVRNRLRFGSYRARTCGYCAWNCAKNWRNVNGWLVRLTPSTPS